MTTNHPVKQEKNSYRIKYINVLEHFVQKYSKDDLWATEELHLYTKKLLDEGTPYSSHVFNFPKQFKEVISTKFKPFSFFSYRYCLLMDCIFLCAYENIDKGKEILQDFFTYCPKRYHKKLQALFDFLFDPSRKIDHIEKIEYMKDCWEQNRVFLTQEPIKVIITANMSAGKSTLLNALVGKKVNKTQNDACTAKIHYIKNKPFEDSLCYEWDYLLDLDADHQYSDELFPTFGDLQKSLVDVIQRSAYSEEVKSNYIGSLVTRVKSLTNGLNGQIFAANETNNHDLFDGKVIVDISRIGSSETKSLIMGILIMRLSEHRMSFCTDMNADLQHVTVLEEAHNILKKASAEPSGEGSNVAGKSVEMISNAIAEMRTYGEGFIIADQSPSAVDISAIRNTNTKIIMRLPDEHDRRLAGKSAALKDNQLDEIAKLPKGVAVVYQNDWLEPVLCQVGKFRGEERIYKKTSANQPDSPHASETLVVKELLIKATGEKLDLNLGELTALIVGLNIPSRAKIAALKALRKNGSCTLSDISCAIYELVCSPTMEKEADEADSIEDWRNIFVYASNSPLTDLSESEQNAAVECILREQIHRFDKPVEYLDIWDKFLKGDVIQ